VVEEGVQKLKKSPYETIILHCLINLINSLLYIPTTEHFPEPVLEAVAKQEPFSTLQDSEPRAAQGLMPTWKEGARGLG
jgi:hypothetical protein